jgi:tRNA nucleotidyltransferase (CCA-adding enzyme)
MTEVLDRDLIVLLRRIGEIADQALVKAFAVGGFVRDLLLKIKNLDLDVVIEGDGIAFSRLLGRELGAEVRVHEKFATATLVLPDGFKVDVATARLEYYEYPAAMPTVELSSIKLDLLRRDFTINAMAIHLNPVRFGTLEDFFGSQNDLNNQWIRVLHNLSFVEDPTRIFRAIRFEQRLGFTIIKSVEKLIRNAVRQNLFGRCQGRRFFNELRHILSGSNPIPCLRRMAEFDLFRLLWPELKPNLKVDRRFIHVLSQAQGALSWFMRLYLDEKCRAWAVYLLAIHSRSRVPDLLAFCERFDVPHRYRDLLVRQKIAADRIALDMLGRPELKPSEISRLLGELSNEGLLYLMAIARKRHINKAVSVYVTALREVRPLVNGNHLCAAGYRPGPLFATLLKESVAAQLDGLVRTRDEALAFLHEHYPLVTTDGDPDRAA